MNLASRLVRLVMIMSALSAVAAAENKVDGPPPLPEDRIILNDSRVVVGVTGIVRWAKDYVVVKHRGGTDPVRFADMAPESRVLWATRAAAGIAWQEREKVGAQAEAAAKAEADETERGRRIAELQAAGHQPASPERRAEAVRNSQIVLGMTADEVRRSWGAPVRVNRTATSGGVTEQWIFRRGTTAYVYLTNGVVTAWQDADAYQK